jgi:hypothetical protein
VLLLDERILADGTHAKTYASLVGDRVRIHDDVPAVEGSNAIRHAVATHVDGIADGQLSVAAVDKVMARYGRALDADVTLDGEALDLPGGYRLRRLRYHAIVDAEGRDYLVWEAPGADPAAAVATMVTAALRYLVLRLAPDGDASKNSGSQIPET